MPNGHVLELATLPDRHPRLALLVQCGLQTVLRLSRDPHRLPPGRMSREVAVSWRRYPGRGEPELQTRKIGWANLPALLAEQLANWPATENADEITEKAAIGVMALLIGDLEGGRIRTVLPIGSGGDYLVAIPGSEVERQVECSGIRAADGPGASEGRLRDKTAQVLREARSGFVSVTTFSFGAGGGGGVHSFLHFVERSPGGAAGGAGNEAVGDRQDRQGVPPGGRGRVRPRDRRHGHRRRQTP